MGSLNRECFLAARAFRGYYPGVDLYYLFALGALQFQRDDPPAPPLILGFVIQSIQMIKYHVSKWGITG
jgi:hypothetical protein